MGVCTSSPDPIDAKQQKPKKGKENENEKIKLLLLGCGESGKSTIFKQMRILHGKPQSAAELLRLSDIIRANCTMLIVALAHFVKDEASVNALLSAGERKSFDKIVDSVLSDFDDKNVETNANHCMALQTELQLLWKSAAFKEAWSRRASTDAIDGHNTFLDSFDEIVSKDYEVPSHHLLLSRVRTEGVISHSYIIDGAEFEMFDVGGQRYFRKTWFDCFEDVAAIIFVASLSEFDQMLAEDKSKNRMTEALDLFSSVLDNNYFEKTDILLFLNKKDLFANKIRNSDIATQTDFSDYSGKPNDFDSGVNYFIDKFVAFNEDPERQVFVHITCATDTSNISFVWGSCKEIILESNLKASGLF